MMKKGVIIGLLAFLAGITFIYSCTTSKTNLKNIQLANEKDYDKLEHAENMLRMDDFRDFEKAEEEFQSLRKNNPDNAYIDGWLAQLYVSWAEQLRTEIHVLKWQLSAAKNNDDLKKQKEIKGLLTVRVAQLGKTMNKAEQLCNSLITYNQENYIGHRVMADYYRIMGDMNMMKLEMVAVERLNSQSVGLMFLKGTAEASFDRNYPAAIGYFNKALKKDPMFIKALYFKGLAYHALKKPDIASTIMQEVLAKSPGHPGATLYLDANKYVATLRKELYELAIDNSNYQIEGDKDLKLIKWACEWIDNSPAVSLRIRGDQQQISNLLVTTTLIGENDTDLLDKQKNIKIGVNNFKNMSFIFDDDAEKCKKARAILIKVLMKVPGSDEYRTVETKKTFLPAGV